MPIMPTIKYDTHRAAILNQLNELLLCCIEVPLYKRDIIVLIKVLLK